MQPWRIMYYQGNFRPQIKMDVLASVYSTSVNSKSADFPPSVFVQEVFSLAKSIGLFFFFRCSNDSNNSALGSILLMGCFFYGLRHLVLSITVSDYKVQAVNFSLTDCPGGPLLPSAPCQQYKSQNTKYRCHL